MTGAFLRVKRDGKYPNIEVERMTNAERTLAFKNETMTDAVHWVNFLCIELSAVEARLEAIDKAIKG